MSVIESKARSLQRIRSTSEPVRRFLNVAVALGGIVVTGPLMAIIAALVKLDSRGPAIFRQPRVGIDRRSRGGPTYENLRRTKNLGGRVFTIYKFRTMTCSDGPSEERWATCDDDRVTRMGRILRATRLDELPQLFNVLKGDMNVVGPRPEQPGIFARLRTVVDGYEERQRVLPGITGWAQVNLGYDTTVDQVRQKVELDREYIESRSPSKDLAIMARTMPVIVFRRVWM
jgi:lipopolysaccharide/colanic/teichoic acid biosynthesis glycosyltransferase